MTNSNEQTDTLKQNAVTEHLGKQDDSKMWQEFEKSCQKVGLHAVRRMHGGKYALDIVEHMWLGYKLAHTSAAEKYKGAVEAAWEVIAQYDKNGDGWELHVITKLAQALAKLEQE